jgi:hypothetical protein
MIKMESSIEVFDFTEARIRARHFILSEFPEVRRIRLDETWEEEGIWTVKGEMIIRKGVLSYVKKNFTIKIDASSGEIIDCHIEK